MDIIITSTHYSAAEITPAMAARMLPADRAALKVLLPVERQAKIEARSERELQRMCEMELSRRNIVFLHLSFRAREKVGWPDLTFVINARNCWGIPMAVELKTVTGKLTVDQEKIMQRMGANGWRCCVCRSFEQFKEIIKEEK